jgi:hypothetical protein
VRIVPSFIMNMHCIWMRFSEAAVLRHTAN